MKYIQSFRHFLAVLLLVSAGGAQAQNQPTPPDTPAYLRTRQVPSFKILLPDSATYFYKYQLPGKSPVVMIWFNPGCDHCQQETRQITDSMHLFKDVQFVFATYAPLAEIRKFYEDYGLGRFSNIKMGRDEKYLLPAFYQLRYIPFAAVYNKEGYLTKVFEGGSKMPVLAAACRE